MTRLQRLSLMGLTLLSAGLVGMALSLAGGPGRARAEMHDAARLDDLLRIEEQASCLARHGAPPVALPLPVTEVCPTATPATDAQGRPYRIATVDPAHLRLCADFELPLSPDDALRPGRFLTTASVDGDCLVIATRPPEVPAQTPSLVPTD